MRKDVALYANVLNVLGMVLFVALDYERGYLAGKGVLGDVGFIVGAIVFIVDAFLFLAVWEGASPHPGRTAIWAEYMNVLGSLIYLQTAFEYSQEDSSKSLTDSVFVEEALATFIFFLSALLGFGSYLQDFTIDDALLVDPVAPSASDDHTESLLAEEDRPVAPTPRRRSNGCTPRAVLAVGRQMATDINFWCNVLNVLPAVVYLVSALGTVQLHFASRDDLLQTTAGPVHASAPLLPDGASDGTAAIVGSAAVAGTAVRRVLHRAGGLRGLARRLSPFSGGCTGRPAVSCGVSGSPPFDPPANERRPALLVSMSRSYIVGDLLWTADAVLCTVAWYRSWMEAPVEVVAGGGRDARDETKEGTGARGGDGGRAEGDTADVEEGYHVLLCLHRPASMLYSFVSTAARKALGTARDVAAPTAESAMSMAQDAGRLLSARLSRAGLESSAAASAPYPRAEDSSAWKDVTAPSTTR